MVCTQGQVTLLTSIGELWTLDSGDTRLSPVTGLLARRVTQVSGGQHHLAAVTDQGQLFTWTEDSVNPVQVAAALMGHNVVQVACGQSPDHQVLAITDAGCIYSWVGAGQGGGRSGA